MSDFVLRLKLQSQSHMFNLESIFISVHSYVELANLVAVAISIVVSKVLLYYRPKHKAQA